MTSRELADLREAVLRVAHSSESTLDSSDDINWHVELRERQSDIPIEECLVLFRELRDSEAVPPVVGFALVANALLEIADNSEVPREIEELNAREMAMEREYGLVRDEVPPEDWPADYVAIRAACEAAWAPLYASMMREHGETEMAQLFLEDRDAFWEFVEDGNDVLAGGTHGWGGADA